MLESKTIRKPSQVLQNHNMKLQRLEYYFHFDWIIAIQIYRFLSSCNVSFSFSFTSVTGRHFLNIITYQINQR